MKVVYISYTGAMEPLGQSQVVAYLRGLAARGVGISLVTFEKGADFADVVRREATANDLCKAGIEWLPQTYRRDLPGKLLNVFQGAWVAWGTAQRTGARLFHARSHVAGAMAFLARAAHGGRLLFDLRGEIAEEYADAGHWRRGGLLYRATRLLEQQLLRRSDAVVVLTERLARRIVLRPGAPLVVIPCCVDRRLFTPVGEGAPEVLRHLEGRPILVYSGSIGTWYLLDEMLAFFARVARRRPDLHLLVLSLSDHEQIQTAAKKQGIRSEQLTLCHDHYQRVPSYLRACAAGLSLIRPVASKEGSSPTKVAEYLACGLPVIVNAGVGDLADFVEQDGVGVLLRSFEEDELERGAGLLASLIDDPERARERCLATALRLFDLDSVGVERYHALYQRLGAV